MPAAIPRLFRRLPGRLAAVILLACVSPSVGGAALPWPGETWSAATNLTSLAAAEWATNLSGAYWNPATRRLWVCTNGPAKLWSLRENGAGGFAIDQAFTGTGDLEAITQTDAAPDRVFVLDEQARTIRSYRVSDGAALTTWFLGTITDWGNLGPEGLAFVPEAWLTKRGFVDGTGAAYPQSVHGANGFGGLVFVAVQTSGWVYAFDLKIDGTYVFVGRYLSVVSWTLGPAPGPNALTAAGAGLTGSPQTFTATATDPAAVPGLDPDRPAMSVPVPNPGREETRVSFRLPRAAFATINVFDVQGQLVKTIARDAFPAGRHEAVWDGRRADGSRARAGVYFYCLRSGDSRATRRGLLLE